MMTADNGEMVEPGIGVGRRTALAAAAASSALVALPAMKSSANEPQRGGTLRVATDYSGPDETLDPTRMTSSTDTQRSYQVYGRLIDLDTGMVPVPMLAIEWEATPDAREWTFVLRDGVEFHDGRTLVADDVAYSINEHRREDSGSPLQPLVAPIQEIVVPDARTVRFVLDAPNADFPYLFADEKTAIVPAGWKDGDAVNGTGPYRLVEFQPGLESVTERFANFWRDGAAFVDSIVTRGIPDITARMNALRAGDIDVTNRLDPKLAAMLDREESVVVHSTPSGAHFLWVMMCDRAPTDNLDVRLALKHAVDRDYLVEQVLLGHGIVANDVPVPPFLPTYCKELPQTNYDPDKARFHWQKAGLDKIVLHASNAPNPVSVDASIVLQEQARAAGIEIELNRVPEDGYWSHTYMQVPFHVSGWGSTRATSDLILTLAHFSTADWNETQFKSERVDELLIEARGTLDADRRYEIYCEVQRIIHGEGGAFIPFFRNYIDGTSSRVNGFQGRPTTELAAGWLYQEVWLS